MQNIFEFVCNAPCNHIRCTACSGADNDFDGLGGVSLSLGQLTKQGTRAQQEQDAAKKNSFDGLH